MKTAILHSKKYYIIFYCIFDQLNAALVNISDFFQKSFKNILPTPNFKINV